MTIKCTKCGAENRLGAIFCHSCGERLDMNSVEDQIGQEREKEKTKNVFKKIRTVISLLLLLAIIAILAGLFIPVTMEYGTKVETDIIRKARRSAEDALYGTLSDDENDVKKFSSAELTAAANGVSGLYGKAPSKGDNSVQEKSQEEEAPANESWKSGWDMEPEIMSVKILPDKRVRAILKLSVKEKIKLYNTVYFDFSGEFSKQSLKPSETRFGWIPLPKPFNRFVHERFEAAFSGSEAIAKLKKRVKDIRIKDDKLILKLKRR